MRLQLLIVMILMVFAASSATAAKTEFNYQGRLNVRGGPYSGAAEFRFAIMTKDLPSTETVLWTNDGGDLGVIPPSTGVVLQVDNGYFVVQIGNEELTNMAALPASIFNSDEDLYLRVWVDDGASGLEQLTPDRKITLPSAIGVRSNRPLTLYVDPVRGNDRYPGHKPSHPKQTIQAAVDSLPVVLDDVTVIQLAAGTYHENVLIQNFTLSGKNAMFVLLGNEADPGSVVLEGNGAGSGITARGMPYNSYVKGLTIRNYGNGMYARGADIILVNATIDDCEYGVFTNYGAGSIQTITCTVKNCEWGYFVGGSFSLTLSGGLVTNTRHEGIRSIGAVRTTINGGTTVDDCGNDGYSYGIRAMDGSSVYIHDGKVKNCSIGALLSSENSFLNTNILTLTNNGTGMYAVRGGILRYSTINLTHSQNTLLTNSDSISHVVPNNS